MWMAIAAGISDCCLLLGTSPTAITLVLVTLQHVYNRSLAGEGGHLTQVLQRCWP